MIKELPTNRWRIENSEKSIELSLGSLYLISKPYSARNVGDIIDSNIVVAMVVSLIKEDDYILFITTAIDRDNTITRVESISKEKGVTFKSGHEKFTISVPILKSAIMCANKKGKFQLTVGGTLINMESLWMQCNAKDILSMDVISVEDRIMNTSRWPWLALHYWGAYQLNLNDDQLLNSNGSDLSEQIEQMQKSFSCRAYDFNRKVHTLIDASINKEKEARARKMGYSPKLSAPVRKPLSLCYITSSEDTKSFFDDRNVGKTVDLSCTERKAGLKTILLRRTPAGKNDFIVTVILNTITNEENEEDVQVQPYLYFGGPSLDPKMDEYLIEAPNTYIHVVDENYYITHADTITNSGIQRYLICNSDTFKSDIINVVPIPKQPANEYNLHLKKDTGAFDNRLIERLKFAFDYDFFDNNGPGNYVSYILTSPQFGKQQKIGIYIEVTSTDMVLSCTVNGDQYNIKYGNSAAYNDDQYILELGDGKYMHIKTIYTGICIYIARKKRKNDDYPTKFFWGTDYSKPFQYKSSTVVSSDENYVNNGTSYDTYIPTDRTIAHMVDYTNDEIKIASMEDNDEVNVQQLPKERP